MNLILELILRNDGELAKVFPSDNLLSAEKRADLYCQITKNRVFRNDYSLLFTSRKEKFLQADEFASSCSDEHKKSLRHYLLTCEIDQILFYAACSPGLRGFLNSPSYQSYSEKQSHKFWFTLHLNTFDTNNLDVFFYPQIQCLKRMRERHVNYFNNILQELEKASDEFPHLKKHVLKSLIESAHKIPFNDFVKNCKSFFSETTEAHRKYVLTGFSMGNIRSNSFMTLMNKMSENSINQISFEVESTSNRYHPSGYQTGGRSQAQPNANDITHVRAGISSRI